MSSGSGTGSGADQHLLALLRAIRLRQAAPDAVAAGMADAAAALTEGLGRRGPAEGSDEPPAEGEEEGAGHHALPPPEFPRGAGAPPRPGWASPGRHDDAVSPAAEPDISKTGAMGEKSPDAFFERGPLLRPRGLMPVDPLHRGEETEAVAPVSSDEKGDGAGPEAEFDVEERAGRLSRNRFAGLTPIRREPPTIEPKTGGDPGGRDSAAPGGSQPGGSQAGGNQAGGEQLPGRPLWASGSGEQPGVEATAPRVPKMPGMPTPRLEGIVPPMVAPGRAPAHDGMDPADEALLRQTKRLLTTSLSLAGGPLEVARRLRAALLQASPALLAAIPGDAENQTARFAVGLAWLVHHLDQPPVLVGGAGKLGAALAECGVAPERLQFVGAALAEAIRAGLPAGEWGQEYDLAWRSTWQHLNEWIRHGAAAAGDEPMAWTAVVVSHELRRPDLAVVRLRPYLPMPFRPGQFARIEVSLLPGIWRPYSLAGAPRRDDVVELHVRAKTHTGVSGTLVYRTRVGDEVRIGRAEGDMRLPDRPDRNLLMIAGDTGVAPLKALLTELADTGDARSAVLFWGVRNLAELYDIEEIAEIARGAKRATVVPVVSEGDPGPYASGLVTDAVAAYGEWSRHEVYLAGPPLMLAATGAALHLLGVAPDHIHHDPPE